MLGLLLFLVFINDIDGGLDSLCFLFADDTTLLEQYNPGQENIAISLIDSDLWKVQDWA